MAVRIKAKPKASVGPVALPLAVVSPAGQLTASYITLQRNLEALGVPGIQAHMEIIKQELLALTADYPADSAVVFTSKEGTIEFSKEPETRTVKDPLFLIKHVEVTFGTEVAQSIAKVGVTDLSKVLTETEMKPFLDFGHGTRKMGKVVKVV